MARSLGAPPGTARVRTIASTITGTALDERTSGRAFYRILDAADLDRRGPYQMRHTFASLLLQEGAPITYVSRQLGHEDLSITLRVRAHWLPDASNDKLVDVLDDAAPRALQTAPSTRDGEDEP